MNFAGFAKGEPIMGIPVVGRCRPSDCGILSNHQHLQDEIHYLGTPVHAYSNRKDDENKSFAVIFTFSNVLNGFLNLILLCAPTLMRPCRPRDRPGQTCGGSPVTDLKHACNTETRSVRLSHQHIQHAGWTTNFKLSCRATYSTNIRIAYAILSPSAHTSRCGFLVKENT